MSETASKVVPKEQVWGVVGYRHFTDRDRAFAELDRLASERGAPKRVVSGGALGADTLAKEWAAARGIAFVEHRAEGANADGIARASALLARNSLIARDCTVLIAFRSKHSRGTLDTMKKATQLKKTVIPIDID